MTSIAISSGHGKFVRGAKGILDEVDEARRVVDEVAKILKCPKFHDDTSKTVSANLNAIVSWHKKQTRDVDVSVHFNAFKSTASPMGVEVCYRSQQSLASKASKAIADAGRFTNRGAKNRTNLYFLNNAKNPILLEVCFVDSKADTDLYKANFGKICSAIAESIAGTAAPGPTPPPSGRPTVRRGSKGDAVVSVQRSLGLPADGDFGPTTEAGVKAFQRAQGTTADGIVGPIGWGLLDQLDARMEAGNDGVAEDLEGAIDQAVIRSGVASINWPGRGTAPEGYNFGVAKTFALAVERYLHGDGAAAIMAQAATGNASTDALTYLRPELEAKGLKCDRAGLDTLRTLFVLLWGLGMRESTGNHWRGKDPGASNTTADTCEAGAWQQSWNLNTASNEIKRLFDEYRADPNGFRDSFTVGARPTADHVETYGTGTGATFQWLAKYSPAFACLMTAVGVRLRRQHWGPINRKEVSIELRVADLLTEVQRLVENREPAEPEPITPEVPEQPEPGAAEVAIDVAYKGVVFIKAEEPTTEPSDEAPEVEIIIRAKGSVAVNLNVGKPEEIADRARVGHVRHDG